MEISAIELLIISAVFPLPLWAFLLFGILVGSLCLRFSPYKPKPVPHAKAAPRRGPIPVQLNPPIGPELLLG